MTTTLIGSATTEQVQWAADEAGAQIALLEQLLGQLRAEHADGAPERQALLATIERAESEAQRIVAQIDRLKAEAKQYKRQIDDWKQWYHALSGINRTFELAKLHVEIQWRSATIATLEAKIGALFTAHTAATTALHMSQQRLHALDAGVYERSISEDPRILNVMQELEAARARNEALNRAYEVKPAH